MTSPKIAKIYRRTALAALPVLAVALGACSSSGSSGSSPTPTTASASPSGSQALKTDNLTAEQVEVTGTGKELTASFPVPSAAQKLSTRDVIVGTGAAVKPTSTITFNYVGVGALSGQVFDSSFQRGEPITYPLANLIPGWQQGLPAMKAGGRRILVIPGALGYPQGTPDGSIQPGETLVFVLDVVAVK